MKILVCFTLFNDIPKDTVLSITETKEKNPHSYTMDKPYVFDCMKDLIKHSEEILFTFSLARPWSVCRGYSGSRPYRS